MLGFIHLTALTDTIIKPFSTMDFLLGQKLLNVPKFIDQDDIAYTCDTLMILNELDLELYDLKTYVKLASITLPNTKRVVGFYDNLLAITTDGIYSITNYGSISLLYAKDMNNNIYKKLYMDAENLYIVLEQEYIVIDHNLDFSIHLKEEGTYIAGRNKYWNLCFTELDDVTIATKNKIYFRDQVIDNLEEGWVHCLAVGISQRNYNELYRTFITDSLESKLLFRHRLAKVIGSKSSYVIYTTDNHPNHLVIYSLKHHRILEILFFQNEVLEIFNFNVDDVFGIVVDGCVNFYTIVKGKTILSTQWNHDLHQSSYVLPVIVRDSIIFHGFEDIRVVCEAC